MKKQGEKNKEMEKDRWTVAKRNDVGERGEEQCEEWTERQTGMVWEERGRNGKAREWNGMDKEREVGNRMDSEEERNEQIERGM